MKWKKVATAILYPAQAPIGVWAGYELAISNWIMGGILTGLIMMMEFCAVCAWMDAQSSQTVDELKKRGVLSDECGTCEGSPNKTLEIRDTAERGKGIFAKREIKGGENIAAFWGEIFGDDWKTYHLKEDWLMSVDMGIYMYAKPPLRYTNHSCDPNAGIVHGLILRAIKDIHSGDEITIDYDTVEYEWSMNCRCGMPECRKIINGWQYLSDDLKNKYLKLGMVMPYLLSLTQNKLEEGQ